MKKFALVVGAVLLLSAVMPLHAQGAAAPLSAAALYNQGNAFARAGKPGMAVLNYERAQLLMPGDSDLQGNLDAVRVSQHLPVAPRSWLKQAAMFPTPSVAAGLGLLGLLCLGVAAIAGRLTGNRSATIAAAIFGTALLTLNLGQAALLWPLLHAGVVIAHEAPVRVSPAPMGEALLVLPEAETVTLGAEHDDYELIKTRSGQVGWVLRTNLARVVTAEH